jgi:hypothetical protein
VRLTLHTGEGGFESAFLHRRVITNPIIATGLAAQLGDVKPVIKFTRELMAAHLE